MAQSQLMDALEADRDVPETVRCFASLGAFGAHTHNEERDLHRWLKNLHQISLEPYYIKLEVEGGASEIVFFIRCHVHANLYPSTLRRSTSSLWAA